MKRKIALITVISLIVATTFPIASAINVDEKETPSSRLAITEHSNKLAEVHFRNDIEELNKGTLPFYGYCAWYPGRPFEGPVSFNSTTPGDITEIKKTSSEGFISGGTWALGKWYGCEYALGEWEDTQPLIWTIHPVIGEMTIVGNYDPEGTNLTFNGLAYNHITEIMYGCSNNALYEVNMSTGASSFVGNFGISDCIMIAIAFDGDGNLFGTELVTDSLYSINPISGEATQIGDGLGININYQQDMAFDIDTDTLYLSAYTIAPVKEGALYTCNKVTGVANKVGTFQGAAEITGFAIPYSGIPKIISSSIIGGNLRIGQSRLQCTIKNIGGLRCNNVTLKITSHRGFILGLGVKPIVYYLEPGKSVNITSQTIYGIGFPMVTLIITATQESSKITYRITKDAYVFGILWWC
jgi:hypothetical protein